MPALEELPVSASDLSNDVPMSISDNPTCVCGHLRGTVTKPGIFREILRNHDSKYYHVPSRYPVCQLRHINRLSSGCSWTLAEHERPFDSAQLQITAHHSESAWRCRVRSRIKTYPNRIIPELRFALRTFESSTRLTSQLSSRQVQSHVRKGRCFDTLNANRPQRCRCGQPGILAELSAKEW